jgi:hypothetical protein
MKVFFSVTVLVIVVFFGGKQSSPNLDHFPLGLSVPNLLSKIRGSYGETLLSYPA